LSEIETHTIDPSAASPGAILKRCREYHEISLEEAEEATKIGANYLQALEEDQISQFASVAYLKGFLRIYTTYLGLNPDDMIRLYDKLFTSGSTQADHTNKSTETVESRTRKKFPLQKLMMPAVLLMLIIIASAIINRSPSSSLRQNQPAPPSAPIAVTAIQPVLSSVKQLPPTKKPTETVVELQRPDSLPTVQNKIQPTPPESTKSFIVRMKVTQSGSLTVTIDGSISQVYDLIIGDSIEWKADSIISLELSNSGGVEIELNGRQLKPFGQAGKPAVVVLDKDGVKQ
jgi:cytoskeletal protein RodZ